MGRDMQSRSKVISVRSPGGNGSSSLTLQPVTIDDLDDYYALHSDARVWQHLPSGRHSSINTSKKQLAGQVADWNAGGLSYWSIKSEDGQLCGIGGATVIGNGTLWNLYYRVAYDWWGCGIAAQVAMKALEAANFVRPELPVVAFLLEHNEASRKIAEKVLKLSLIWQGPDAKNPDSHAIRLVFSDRPLDEAALKVVTM